MRITRIILSAGPRPEEIIGTLECWLTPCEFFEALGEEGVAALEGHLWIYGSDENDLTAEIRDESSEGRILH